MPDSAVTVPLFGFGYGAKSPNVSAQQRENLYVEMLKDPDKTALALYQRPGLASFANSTIEPGPIRGIVTDALYSGVENIVYVQGQEVFTIDSSGTITAGGVGVIVTTSGVVRAAQVGQASIFIDGTTGYIIDNPSFPAAVFNLTSFPQAASFPFTTTSICAIASRFVAVDPSNTGRFRWSAAGDGRTWNALDFATAESSPDPLSAVFEMAGQLLLIGTQTIEFWSPTATGAANQLPFQRVGGANIQWGTTAVDTIRKCNDRVIFLGRNQGGNRQVVALQGYQAQVISTPDIEAVIATQSNTDLDAATALFVVVAGHPFYILNLPTQSLAYDILTDSWAKWTTAGSRFAGQWSTPAFGGIVVTDAADGHLYKLDTTTYFDGGAGTRITRTLVSKHAWANLARMSLRELRIDCQTGVAVNLALSWSKDGGNTFGTPVSVSLNGSGTLTTAVWRNLGRARDWVFKLTTSDQAPSVIIGAAAIFQP